MGKRIKKILITSGLFCFTTVINSQSIITTIKSQCNELKHEMEYDSQFRLKFTGESILNLDVFNYYQIRDNYDTELKQKVYKETQDYKDKLSELKIIKNDLLSDSYYLDFKPSFYFEEGKYNIELKSFTFISVGYQSDFIKRANYLQFDKLLLQIPIGINVKFVPFDHGNGVYFFKQLLSFKIENQDLALNIENCRKDIRILFIFNFTQIYPFINNNILGMSYKDYYYMTNLQKIILYNSKTDEIYAEYNKLPAQQVKKNKNGSKNH